MTYAQARLRLFAYLRAEGWDVREYDAAGRALKVPHATADRLRLWFKPQAVWFSVGNAHTLSGARSLHCDIRRESPAAVVATAERMAAYMENVR